MAWPVAGTITALGLAHLSLLVLQARLTWEHPHYRFFPLILVGAVLLAVRNGRRLGPLEPGFDRWSAPMLIAAWAMLAVACLIGSPWLGTLAALATAPAVVYAIGGRRLLVPLLPAWGLLWLATPPPLNLDYELISRLQTMATRWSSGVLDLLGVFHLREGNVIRLTDRQLLIEEACSGVHSFFAVLAGTIFLAIWARRSLARGIVLVVAAVAWVVLSNTLRVVAVAYLAGRWKLDAASGWRHEALGLAVFALALGLTASTDCLISFFDDVRGLLRTRARERMLNEAIVPPPSGPAPSLATPTRLPDLRGTCLASWPLAAAYGVLIAAQPVLMPPLFEDIFRPGSVVASRLLAVRADDLPASWGSFRREGFQTERRDLSSINGQFSQTWTYRWGRRVVTVSLDGPFQGWHDLTMCYTGAGWTTHDQSVRPGEAPGGAFTEVRIERPQDQKGELFFSLFNDQGRALGPTRGQGRLGYLRDHLGLWRNQRTTQVQLFVVDGVPLTSAEREQVLAFFQAVRSQLIARLGTGGQEASP